MRGYAAIGLDNPKDHYNVGGALRAVHCYGASLVVMSGARFRKSPTDTMAAWRHTPLIQAADIFDAIPFSCVPVAIDLVDGATPLPSYEHPERAFYIFGAEDQTLGRRILDRCRDRVMVPMHGCMNLAATVNVVLYDRMAKEKRHGREQ